MLKGVGSQHPSRDVITLRNFKPQIWPEIITSRAAQNVLVLKAQARNTSPRGSTGVQRYGCIPRSAANNLGEIPKKLGAPNLLF